MNLLPLVTVLVPAKEEAADIEGCLSHIAAQDYPVNRIEVIVIDGASTDATATIAEQALARYGFAAGEVVTNENGTTSSNLNVGLRRARGAIVVRVDARSRIERHHVRKCVEILTTRPDVAVVGGSQLAVARDARAVSVGIARALNNRWSMGFSRYRMRTSSGPADTVYLGAFRADQLRALDGWDERLLSNQDFDLNRRMSTTGAIWFETSMAAGYLPRPALSALWSQYVRFGRAKAFYWRLTGDRPQPRQLALMIVPLALVVTWVAAVIATPSVVATLLFTTLTAMLVLMGLDELGTSGPRASFASRITAVPAMLAIGAGWLWGVFSELARSWRSRPEQEPAGSLSAP